MMRRLIYQEWRVLRRDHAFWWALLFFSFLLGYGVWNGARQVRSQERVLPLLAKQEAQKRRENREFFVTASKYPQSNIIPWHSGIVAYQLWPHNVLPPAPMAETAIGQSDLQPLSMQARTRFDMALAPEEIENPVNLLTGRFDLAFVIVYLLPLLILGVCYNLLSNEREGGTLLLALSNPVALRVLVAAKILVRAVAIMVVTLGATWLFLQLNQVDFLAPQSALRLMLWSCAVVLYGVFWFALAAWINARGGNSASNAIVLSGTWLALVLIVPSLLSAAATTLHPPPPRLELTQAIHRAEDAAMEQGRVLLESYYRAHPDLRPGNRADLNDYWTQRYAMNAHMEKQLAPLLSRVDDSSALRQKLANNLNFLSPALLTQSALSDIAGVGDARYNTFTQQVDVFRNQWRTFFLPRIFRQSGLPPEEWKQIPQWKFREENNSDVAKRVIPVMLALLLATLLLSVGTWSALRRYAVAG